MRSYLKVWVFHQIFKSRETFIPGPACASSSLRRSNSEWKHIPDPVCVFFALIIHGSALNSVITCHFSNPPVKPCVKRRAIITRFGHWTCNHDCNSHYLHQPPWPWTLSSIIHCLLQGGGGGQPDSAPASRSRRTPRHRRALRTNPKAKRAAVTEQSAALKISGSQKQTM